MKTTAAVLRQADQPYVLEEIELDPPGPGEEFVHVVGAGYKAVEPVLTPPSPDTII